MKNKNAQSLMQDNMLVKHYAGSISYGTNLPSSDVDFRGIFCADPVNILTPFFPIRECEDLNEEDTKLYELSHFMKLCVECNPNIIETLWVDNSDITFRTPAYELLRDNRKKLLSAKIAFTTSGYALAQLKRIKGHNKWINNPQQEQAPRQIDFVSLVHNFTDDKIFKVHLKDYQQNYRLVPYGRDIYGLYQAEGYQTFDELFTLNTQFDPANEHDKDYFTEDNKRKHPLFIVKWNKNDYNMAKDTHNNYWNWKKNRNKTRSEFEEQFGYDTKHAMHLVRLLRMGEEVLQTGELLVKRPDAKELLSIRNGAWSYKKLVAYAEEKDDFIRNSLYTKTTLPKKPNLNFAAELLMDVQKLVWKQSSVKQH